MKTIIDAQSVEFNGKIAQLNCVYKLIDGTHAVLDGVSELGFMVSRLNGGSLDLYRESWPITALTEATIILGTIKDAPAELIDGKAYQFEFEGKVCLGIFSSEYRMRLFNNGDFDWREDWVTNIRPLILENKE
jgi:hypothetical protein